MALVDEAEEVTDHNENSNNNNSDNNNVIYAT